MPLPDTYTVNSGFALYESGLNQSFGSAPTNNTTVTLNSVEYKFSGLAIMRFTYSNYIRDALWFSLSTDDSQTIPAKPFTSLVITDQTESLIMQMYNRQGDSKSSVDGPYPQLDDIGDSGLSKVLESDTENNRRYRYWLWALDTQYGGSNVNYSTSNPDANMPSRDDDGLLIPKFSTTDGEEIKFYVIE